MILVVIIKYHDRFPLTAARPRPRRCDPLAAAVSLAFGECHTTSRRPSLSVTEGERDQWQQSSSEIIGFFLSVPIFVVNL